jgi:FAD/FMN-containing dehydrogenase
MTANVLRPGDTGYDAARTVWNAMVDRRPREIHRCASTADVQAAVRTARERGLELGVRCGGHGILGLAVPDDGLMIDLTPMGAVTVDPARRLARVQGGALLGALDDAAQPHGLATTAGNVSHTGVGGLTLGGGMGWLARTYGLACDNVVAFELVTADGDVLTVTADEHPDLFWALRGGGGNFGVVTGFAFRLHDTGTRALTAGWTYPLDAAAGPLRAWRDLSAQAPRAATCTAQVSDDGVTVGFVWVGDPAGAAPLIRDLDAQGGRRRVTELSYRALQRRDDAVDGHAFRRYWKGHYLRDLPDAALDALLVRGPCAPAVELQAYDGAIADVPDDVSAFSQRETKFEYVAAARWTDAGEDADRMAAARRCGAALAPFAAGMYVNVIADEGAAGVRRAFPPAKLARLRAVKTAYDPSNVFHRNANIPPEAAA